MKKAGEYCKIVADDETNSIAKWIAKGLKLDDVNALCCMGFVHEKKLIGGVMYEGSSAKSDLWMNIYTTDKRWCCRRTVKVVFDFAFNRLGVDRVSILVDEDNLASLSFVKRLGFVNEGMLRRYRRGKNVYVFGMLKNECNFL